MRTLSTWEFAYVTGGSGGAEAPTNADADRAIGKAVGKAWHSLNSTPARVLGAISPTGLVMGAIWHYVSQH